MNDCWLNEVARRTPKGYTAVHIRLTNEHPGGCRACGANETGHGPYRVLLVSAREKKERLWVWTVATFCRRCYGDDRARESICVRMIEVYTAVTTN